MPKRQLDNPVLLSYRKPKLKHDKKSHLPQKVIPFKTGEKMASFHGRIRDIVPSMSDPRYSNPPGSEFDPEPDELVTPDPSSLVSASTPVGLRRTPLGGSSSPRSGQQQHPSTRSTPSVAPGSTPNPEFDLTIPDYDLDDPSVFLASAARRAQRVFTCDNCDKPRRTGDRECAACKSYRMRHGTGRPQRLIRRDAARKAGELYRAVPKNQPHMVFVIKDIEGIVLYVGISNSFTFRPIQRHDRLMSWWRDIATIEVSHYDDEAEAKRAYDRMREI